MYTCTCICCSVDGHLFTLHMHTATLSSDLKETVKKTLQEYETTLKNQSSHIQQLEGEREMIHSHNEELEQKCTDLEFRLNRVTVSRDALSTRIDEITQSLEGILNVIEIEIYIQKWCRVNVYIHVYIYVCLCL